jgi:ubiquinone/menaquinone biosynthesis C-methylase UbiE
MGNSDDQNERNETRVDSYARALVLGDLPREPVIRAAVRVLDLPQGSRGLDAGCGIGSHTLLLAEAVAPGGRITGLDRSADLLAHARERAARSAFSENVSFRKGDINGLPFDADSFDWLWSVDCAGYIPAEPVTLLKELARVVKPGGRIAILAWTSQQLLPGHPEMEARLNATKQGIAPFAKGSAPYRHILRAPGWFREAGLQEVTAQTFAGDVCAPLSEEIRSAMIALLEMRWGDPRSELSDEDGAAFERLCTPGSPDFLVDLPDYYAFFTYSMFSGRIAP